ncbi:MAG: flavodoxin FldA [Clostridia bacterium]|nr:flavodoxin FldA [Clostridia bacterium]
MGSVSIFYGSTTGNTEEVAELMARELGNAVETIKDIAKASAADFKAAENLLLGTSTWDDGQLQQDWEYFFPQLDTIDLTGKKVALFGLGNAQGFSGQFVDALGKLYHKVAERGATICGYWPTDGCAAHAANTPTAATAATERIDAARARGPATRGRLIP